MGSWDPTRPTGTRSARTMRARVLREEPICRTPGCGKPSTQDDHIIGWSQREAAGLTVGQWHSRSNHQGLCEDCHTAKTQGEAAQARTAMQARARHPREAHPGLI